MIVDVTVGVIVLVGVVVFVGVAVVVAVGVRVGVDVLVGVGVLLDVAVTAGLFSGVADKEGVFVGVDVFVGVGVGDISIFSYVYSMVISSFSSRSYEPNTVIVSIPSILDST